MMAFRSGRSCPRIQQFGSSSVLLLQTITIRDASMYRYSRGRSNSYLTRPLHFLIGLTSSAMSVRPNSWRPRPYLVEELSVVPNGVVSERKHTPHSLIVWRCYKKRLYERAFR